MDLALQVAIGAVLGYLFGMIPTGAIVGRRHGIDLTRIGSGSTGATNVLRTLGARWAIVVFVGDLLKGVAAVLVVGWIVGGAPWGTLTWSQVIASAFAVIGHTGTGPAPASGSTRDKPLRQGAIASTPHWPVRLSYYTEGAGERTPIYTLGFDLYENGVSGALKLDYGDFAILGDMTTLDIDATAGKGDKDAAKGCTP